MRTVKISLLAVIVIGLFSLVGCSKSGSTTVVKDSIYYSPWLSITMLPTNAGDTTFAENVSASTVTASVVHSGAVLTYLGEPGYPAAGDTAAESAIDFGLYATLVTGSIQLTSFFADFSTSNSGLVFRYVVIPGTVLATTKLTPQQLKSMSYTEVTKLLGTRTKNATPTTF